MLRQGQTQMATISKTEVMRKAWVAYRRFMTLGQGKAGRSLFAAALRQAWADAKQSTVFAAIIKGFQKAADLAPAAPRLESPCGLARAACAAKVSPGNKPHAPGASARNQGKCTMESNFNVRFNSRVAAMTGLVDYPRAGGKPAAHRECRRHSTRSSGA